MNFIPVSAWWSHPSKKNVCGIDRRRSSPNPPVPINKQGEPPLI
jgi:hypothetical protein